MHQWFQHLTPCLRSSSYPYIREACLTSKRWCSTACNGFFRTETSERTSNSGLRSGTRKLQRLSHVAGTMMVCRLSRDASAWCWSVLLQCKMCFRCCRGRTASRIGGRWRPPGDAQGLRCWVRSKDSGRLACQEKWRCATWGATGTRGATELSHLPSSHYSSLPFRQNVPRRDLETVLYGVA
jgi:hypothetical protein